MIKIIIFSLSFFILTVGGVKAAAPDFDKDGVPDQDEDNVYFTDKYKQDTDGDGFNDWIELNTGYSPHNKKKMRLEDTDTDNDGLSDRMELNFHTNLLDPDTDGDGFSDGKEVAEGFDPLKEGESKLKKKIEIDTKKQELKYFTGGVRMGIFQVSTGKASTPTPKGTFYIDYKHLKAWSRPYGLWMPYWMSLKNGLFGIHELPEWPNGYKEGLNHLGIPVSHGCIRLGVGPAEFIYNWAEIGMEVVIY